MTEDQEIKDRRNDDRRFRAIDERCLRIESQLQQNTELTQEVVKNTTDIVAAWTALSGGLKVLGWLGIAAKYLALFAGAVSALGGAWYALTHWGQPPTR